VRARSAAEADVQCLAIGSAAKAHSFGAATAVAPRSLPPAPPATVTAHWRHGRRRQEPSGPRPRGDQASSPGPGPGAPFLLRAARSGARRGTAGGLLYRCGGAEFQLFQSTGASPGTFTQMSWEVDDIEAVVSELKRRGVVWCSKRSTCLGCMAAGERGTGSPRSKAISARVHGCTGARGARGARGAWFRDSEGNMLGIGQPVT
jgi:hypothetical protein